MRRSVFISNATLAGTIALGIPHLAQAQTLTKLTLASAPNADLIATLWGLETGAFRKVGLDVSLQKANSGSAVAAAVAGGAVDLGKSSLLSLLTGRSKGFPFILVAPSGLFTTDVPATTGIIVAKDSPLKTGADCAGKTVGVAGLNDLTSIATQAWVDQTGGDSKALKFLEVTNSAIPEAVASGRIDMGTVTDPIYGLALTMGKVRTLGTPLSSISRRFMQAAYFTTADGLAKNRAAITAFRRVIVEMSTYANDHPEMMAPVIAKYTGIDPKVMAQQTYQPCATSLDAKLIQPLVDKAISYKVVSAGFDLHAMIDPAAI
jgi:NitT/TauT family transport system substrate-binding protein